MLQVPRNRDREAVARKEPEMNQAAMEQAMAEFFRQFAAQMAMGLGHATQRAIGYEDGKNMRNFLDLVEIDFVERGLDARHWGEELRRYLRGDALGYWLYLRRTSAPLTDWEYLRQQFCARFCNVTTERMKVMMAENVWRYDHTAYSSRFAAIVAQGVSMAPDLLVGYYLANLPDEIYREVTRGGTRKFADWQDAAAALAATAAPWKDSCEERLRFQRDLEDAKRRWAQGPNPIPVSPDWSKKLPGREEKENAEGPDLGENQQPLAIQSHAGTTLLIEEGHASKRDHRSELHSGAGMRETIGHAV
ncbi:uncharacterized protein EMH_0092710 [Eimeria mitis]|uniref:Retrotransposon gag domain-containing protein n=1 Tax=Eimeria mitis TaxID=44415 RepID=U6K9S0_9EIME|nr:uncharacterized protein EMH_0092710 [Eimeria mitis]CDJ34780.1 hypothetical protein, conserved [Eimeria mitis]